MVAALVCREMGWTLEEYEKTPAHFVDTIYSMLIEESAHQQAELKKSLAKN